MNEHVIRSLQPDGLGFVAICACGKEFDSPRRETALLRWEGHLRIVDAREKLAEAKRGES